MAPPVAYEITLGVHMRDLCMQLVVRKLGDENLVTPYLLPGSSGIGWKAPPCRLGIGAGASFPFIRVEYTAFSRFSTVAGEGVSAVARRDARSPLARRSGRGGPLHSRWPENRWSALDSRARNVHVLFVNMTQAIDPAEIAFGDAAPNGPSPERRESCACEAAEVAEGAERRERHLRMLRELGEIGMTLARAVGQRALEEAKALDQAGAEASSAEPAARKSGPDLALVFTRLSRSVRQTLALEQRIAEGKLTPVPRPIPAGVLNRQAERAADAEEDRRERRKDQVERLVKEAIATEHAGAAAVNLEYKMRDRLEDEDIDRDIGTQPIGALVARICWDLGLGPDWSQWSQDYWATEEIRTKAPGSPYADWVEEDEDGNDENGDDEAGDDEAGVRPVEVAEEPPDEAVAEDIPRDRPDDGEAEAAPPMTAPPMTGASAEGPPGEAPRAEADKPLTPAQIRYLLAVAEYTKRHGPPAGRGPP